MATTQQNQSGTVHQNRPLSAEQRSGSTPLADAQAPVNSRIPQPIQKTEIRMLAPEIDWDYAAIERLDPDTLKSTVLAFDLGKLVLQHDASQDLELQASDVIAIFSEADIRIPLAEQTKLVTLSGEFAHAGVYSVLPGESFRHLVERAGGLTPKAYLYGSEFTRESTRTLQQARIDEYVQKLSVQMQRNTLAMAASPLNTAQEVASGPTAQNSAREILSGLKQIRATGRIVLHFTPETTGTASLPDITLEDGDRFVVPPVPATVNVVGAVYNQNSFLFERVRKAGTYLQLAGGPNHDADSKHEFIIRADGEVVIRPHGQTVWVSPDFSNLRINPGDSIVVPEKTIKPSFLRGIIDWSQMFSQLALGASALTVIQ
jgi:hypothetical protein